MLLWCYVQILTLQKPHIPASFNMYLVINKWGIAVKVSNFSGQYLRNHWNLDIGVLGYIGIVWPKEHSAEVWSVPPVTPCILYHNLLFGIWKFIPQWVTLPFHIGFFLSLYFSCSAIASLKGESFECIIFVNKPTWCTIFSYMFIYVLYMFQAATCPLSGELIGSLQHLVYVTLCRWPSGMEVFLTCILDRHVMTPDEHVAAQNM